MKMFHIRMPFVSEMHPCSGSSDLLMLSNPEVRIGSPQSLPVRPVSTILVRQNNLSFAKLLTGIENCVENFRFKSRFLYP